MMMNATTGTEQRTSVAAQTETDLSLPSVLYFDDVVNTFQDDDTGLPPRNDDDDDHRSEPRCVYADESMFDDEDFGDLARTDSDEGCREKPEYFMRISSPDPASDRATVVYYCPRHFASSLGYLCDRMSRRSPEKEIRHFIEHGELPPRARILDFGPMSAIGLTALGAKG